MKKVLTGNYAAAEAAALAGVQVASIYPITPATQIGERLSEMSAEGSFGGRLIRVESEHSAMASLLGAASAGARTFTATSSQGLAYMHEMLHWVSGARLPVVMVDVNRALAAPWNLWSDQSDSLSQRDTGWLQFYCASSQEVLDTVLMAFKISEKTFLPSMVVLDGFTLSHTYEPVDVPDEKAVREFLPPWRPESRLDTGAPAAFGSLAGAKDYIRLRRRMAYDMEQALSVIDDVAKEFERLFGRRYEPLAPYRAWDADTVLVIAGAAAGAAEAAVDELRRDGHRAGSLRLRVFRPFPADALRRMLHGGMRLAVVDRSFSQGSEGTFSQEIKAALYSSSPKPVTTGFVAGLGGGDITVDLLKEIWAEAHNGTVNPAETVWMEDAR
ncbi:MAG: pyruvate ferredoxin oxidoreductase [Elusimicrobia bacterium]|nr:pyruvate ferredoxin oxidoreductase [Elusimicrobiota bacterium]